MNIILNIVGLVVIFLAYALLMSIISKVLAVLVASLKLRPTIPIAFSVSAIATILAAWGPIVGYSYILNHFGYQLSVIPVIAWGLLQLMGIAKSIVGYNPDPNELLMLGISQAEVGVGRMKYIGQFFGTLVGAILGVLFHYIYIL